jgi:hypothetical protein
MQKMDGKNSSLIIREFQSKLFEFRYRWHERRLSTWDGIAIFYKPNAKLSCPDQASRLRNGVPQREKA